MFACLYSTIRFILNSDFKLSFEDVKVIASLGLTYSFSISERLCKSHQFITTFVHTGHNRVYGSDIPIAVGGVVK